MNLQKIYQDATTAGVEEKPQDNTIEKQMDAETERQLREKWIIHPVTGALLTMLGSRIKQLSQENSRLSFEWEKNQPIIRHNITEQKILERIVNYARTGSYTDPK